MSFAAFLSFVWGCCHQLENCLTHVLEDLKLSAKASKTLLCAFCISQNVSVFVIDATLGLIITAMSQQKKI